MSESNGFLKYSDPLGQQVPNSLKSQGLPDHNGFQSTHSTCIELAKRKVITKASNGYWMIDFDVINSAMSSSNFGKTNNTTNYPTCQQSINAQNFFGYGYSDCTVQTYTY